MDEGVDRDQGAANFAPSRIVLVADNEKVRQNHAENFIGNTVNARQWANDGVGHLSNSVRPVIGLGQAAINPTHQIAAGNVAYEQK